MNRIYSKVEESRGSSGVKKYTIRPIVNEQELKGPGTLEDQFGYLYKLADDGKYQSFDSPDSTR